MRGKQHKITAALICGAVALLSAGCSKSTDPETPPSTGVTRYTYSIINEFPHDSTAFTQGLQYVDGSFYESTGLYGASTVRRVSPITGAVLQLRSIAGGSAYFGEGLTVLGERIYQLTWQGRTGFVYDRTTLDSVGQFTYSIQGWGLTFDGEHFVMSDGSAALYFRDTSTFAEVRRVEVRDSAGAVTRLNELEYINGEIYANVWLTDNIVRVNPQSGEVTGWINLAGLLDSAHYDEGADVLNGIAYDSAGDRLFVTGKLWPKVFEIELVEVP